METKQILQMKKDGTILFSQLRELIVSARQAAFRNVNTLQVLTNFLIGKTIVEDQQHGKARAGYAKEQLRTVSRKLTKEFGRGYSVDNLQLMRAFFLAYQNKFQFDASPIYEALPRKSQNNFSKALVAPASSPIYETLSRISPNEKHLLKITWTHFVSLLKMDEDERRFYEIETAANNWSTRELERQYNSSLFERLALSRDKKKVKQLSTKGQLLQEPHDLIRQPYILEFLGLKEETSYSENDLETAIINRIEKFLLELGKGAWRRETKFLNERNSLIDKNRLVDYSRMHTPTALHKPAAGCRAEHAEGIGAASRGGDARERTHANQLSENSGQVEIKRNI